MIDLLPASAVHRLQSLIPRERFAHCRGVMETAFQLADAWKQIPVDRTHLAWASLFHDCGKEISPEQKARLSQNGPILYGKELMDFPKLIHAPLGAKLLQTDFGVETPEVLEAIAYHPTGRPNLGPIGWMVYIADYLEPGRSYFPQRETLLREACDDPLMGLRRVTNLRFATVEKKGKLIHPLAREFKNYLDGIQA